MTAALPRSAGDHRWAETRNASTLEMVLEHNNRRLQQYTGHPLFKLSASVRADVPRQALLACIQRFSRSFQTLMLTRQALCTDPRYYPVFLAHLKEEFGHDELIAQRVDAAESEDPVLDACLTWFSFQMIALDNVEKAALVHLVLETSGDHFHNAAAPHLGPHVETGYFALHAELDEGHAQMGVALLEDQPAHVYHRLGKLLDRAWDILEAASSRIVEIVETSTNCE